MLRIRKFGENQSGYNAALLELLFLFSAASPESVFAKVMSILPSPARTWARTFCGEMRRAIARVARPKVALRSKVARGRARVKKTKIPNAGAVATNVLAQFCVSRSDLRTKCWICHDCKSYYWTTPKPAYCLWRESSAARFGSTSSSTTRTRSPANRRGSPA